MLRHQGRERLSDPWYGSGLKFACTQCGNCCTGDPGHVWVEEHEIERLVRGLGMKGNEFGRKYLRRGGGGLRLIEQASGECVFWDSARGCKVYAHRPDQCRSFPFWPEVLKSREAWEAQAVHCPGMN